jgi:hypothetical protein
MEADKAFNSSALKQASEQALKNTESFRRALSAADFHVRRETDKVAREKEEATK